MLINTLSTKIYAEKISVHDKYISFIARQGAITQLTMTCTIIYNKKAGFYCVF